MRIILTHENADFDAIASLLGVHKLYPQAQPVLPRRINHNVQAFLSLYGHSFPFVTQETLPRGRHIRRVILVDTQSLTSVRGMAPQMDEVLILDHHTPPVSLPEGWRFQGEQLGANTTLLVEALAARLVPVSGAEATLMLAGIYEDTGSLTYAGTTPRDLRAAAWLLDREADLGIVTEFLEHPLSPEQRRIYETLQEHAETLTLSGHPVVIAWAVAPERFTEGVSTLAHKLRDLLSPSALFVLVEMGRHTQLVARSTSDDINVARVAQHFGGGGHDRAAAALIRDRTAQEVTAELREMLPSYVHPRVTVRDLMSHSVRTVRPDTPVAQVAQRMLRTGHEGFPVVDDQGRVIGLVTRNAVDRAMQHQWGRQPVSRVMQAGSITVSPEDAMEYVRSLMIRTGWGQIPVQDQGKLIGVVTRTDLIRQLPPEQRPEDREVLRRMKEGFPPALLALIRQIGTEAAQQGCILYFVGGLVRDLLLGQRIFDVDLVVEGDAIRLGQHLAQQHGGEVRVHSRFGTVKWLLPPGFWQQYAAPSDHDLPTSIDLVTARTEFYERPTALPLVERSSIKQDLHRRDFTINTLAVQLDPQNWGRLLDFFGGKADLEAGIIRVLHSLSFVDDPTRILRAARFETRLGFHIEPRTESLISDALPLLKRITGGRVRHELDMIFLEAQPELALTRLQTLGALQAINQSLVSDPWLAETLTCLRSLDLRDWGLSADKDTRLQFSWSLFLYRLDDATVRHIAKQLLMPHRFLEPLEGRAELRAVLSRLTETLQPGEIADRLDPYTPRSLLLAWIVTPQAHVRRLLLRYIREWRHVRPLLKGDDLRRMGIPPGPIYRDIFRKLRTARLNGQISTRAEEEALVRDTARC